MSNYYVNQNAQATGEHEVHKDTCAFLPKQENRILLGAFISCHDALERARMYFSKVDGCHYCTPQCHKR